MNRIRTSEQSMLGTTENHTDANRLYSILLDTRASTASDNMYDISEKIMKNEKENAKVALEELWSLKKNLSTKTENENETIDLLIGHYQEKLNVLRNKEEHIKKISRDSRELLEEKRKRDAEIATVKQEISDCSVEIDRLNIKMRELKIKEQELILIESQVQKELKLNTNEVVNGLYEIILSSQDETNNTIQIDNEFDNNLSNKHANRYIDQTNIASTKVIHDTTPGSIKREPVLLEKKTTVEEKSNTPVNNTDINASNTINFADEIIVPFPKSVVKTTRGVVIGEYYYDAKVDKTKRHYIYNSNFFRKYMVNALKKLTKNFEPLVYGEAYQMIQDAMKRNIENKSLHFEVSTNEILNGKTLKELKHKLEQRDYRELLAICNRLHTKIGVLGNNYVVMLEEQIARYGDT